MGRPPKKGLDYFSLDVDIFDNHKVEDLLADYGCKGFTVYICILTEIYKNGYYLEMPPERLAVKCMKQIGGGWLKKSFVLDVIHSCGELGLFDNVLLSRGVITSPGIQKRYKNVTARNKVHKDKYWLLDTVEKDETPEGLLKSPILDEYATEKGVSATETKVFDAEMTQKKRKQNIYTLSLESGTPKKIGNKQPYGKYGHVLLTRDQYKELTKLYTVNGAQKRINILDSWIEQKPDYYSGNHYETITEGWVSERAKKVKKSERWNDFNQRDIDYDALVREVNGDYAERRAGAAPAGGIRVL